MALIDDLNGLIVRDGNIFKNNGATPTGMYVNDDNAIIDGGKHTGLYVDKLNRITSLGRIVGDIDANGSTNTGLPRYVQEYKPF